MNQRQKILDKALEMFNERGIEYVGLRELATNLHMRVGNLTYYFPTKDDLVYELSLALSQANSEVFVDSDNLSMREFLEIMQRIFHNHWRFRCLLLSFVHLMTQNKRVAEAYKQTQPTRSTSLYAYILALEKGGYLQRGSESQKELLVGLLSLVSRFWLSEAAISFRQQTPVEQMRHYLKIVAGLLQPYATEKGEPEIRSFLETL